MVEPARGGSIPFDTFSLRRQIYADLSEIGKALLTSRGSLSLWLHGWHERFYEELKKSRDEEALLKRFSKELCEYLLSIMGDRSNIMPVLISFLKRHHEDEITILRIEKAYNDNDPVRLERLEKIRKLAEARAAREKAEAEVKESARKAARESAKAHVDSVFEGIGQDLDAEEEGEAERTQAANAEEAERERRLKEEEAEWEKRNKTLRERVTALHAKMDRVEKEVVREEGAVTQLEVSISKTSQAILDKNRRDEKGAFGQVAVIAAMAAAACVTGVYVAQPPGGGVMLGAVVAI